MISDADHQFIINSPYWWPTQFQYLLHCFVCKENNDYVHKKCDHMLGVDDIMKDMQGTSQRFLYFWVRHGLVNIVCSYWPSSCLLNSCSITISLSQCAGPLFSEVSHCTVFRTPLKDLTGAVWDYTDTSSCFISWSLCDRKEICYFFSCLFLHHLQNSIHCHVELINISYTPVIELKMLVYTLITLNYTHYN